MGGPRNLSAECKVSCPRVALVGTEPLYELERCLSVGFKHVTRCLVRSVPAVCHGGKLQFWLAPSTPYIRGGCVLSLASTNFWIFFFVRRSSGAATPVGDGGSDPSWPQADPTEGGKDDQVRRTRSRPRPTVPRHLGRVRFQEGLEASMLMVKKDLWTLQARLSSM